MGLGCNPQESARSIFGSTVTQRNQRPQKIYRTVGRIPETIKRASRHKRYSVSRRARICLIKKKSELGLKGPLVGYFAKEIKIAVIDSIKQAAASGLTQKDAGITFGINPHKFRRWATPKPKSNRVAWNKILPSEKDAILQTAWDERFIGKPVSHLFV